MSLDICVPALGAGMSEGTLAKWHVADGATVAKGDVLYTLESEKVSQDIEAAAAGVVRRMGDEGEVYLVGHVIGRVE
jgi:pyruvate/2-oxoglutarate dehydrogenase complex dihydrolipoamide acyltransferase (E2) component